MPGESPTLVISWSGSGATLTLQAAVLLGLLPGVAGAFCAKPLHEYMLRQTSALRGAPAVSPPPAAPPTGPAPAHLVLFKLNAS